MIKKYEIGKFTIVQAAIWQSKKRRLKKIEKQAMMEAIIPTLLKQTLIQSGYDEASCRWWQSISLIVQRPTPLEK